MGLIVSKKSLLVAILHFITAGLMLASVVYILLSLSIGGFRDLPDTGDSNQNISNGVATAITAILLIPSMAGMIVATPMFVFSGVKLCIQAQGQLPSKKSFIATLVVKTIGFLVMLPVLVFIFEVPTGLPIAVLHIVLLLLSLASSLLEAYVRRKP